MENIYKVNLSFFFGEESDEEAIKKFYHLMSKYVRLSVDFEIQNLENGECIASGVCGG